MKHRIMKTGAVIALVLAMAVGEFGTVASAAKKDAYLAQTAKQIAKEKKVEEVRTIWYRARTTKKLKVTVVETGEKIALNKKQLVILVQRDYHEKAGVSQCCLPDDTTKTFYIKNKFLSIKKSLCTGIEGDYSKATKLAYVNGNNIPSRTEYMIWISLDKQRVNVFTGTNHNWTLVQEYPCSTGKEDAPTLDQSFKAYYRIQWKKPDVVANGSKLLFYSAVYGSGIHKWPGKGMNKSLGIKPVSHRCVRLRKADAVWIYDTVPIGTRVWIW